MLTALKFIRSREKNQKSDEESGKNRSLSGIDWILIILCIFFALHPTNLFSQDAVQPSTGQVAFPITLFELPGRNGPAVHAQLLYNSPALQNSTTINRERPTGIVGLGWTFPRERILRMTNGTGNTEDDEYYLYSGVGVNALIPVSASNGVINFQTRSVTNYKIQYTPASESWTVTNAEGIRYIYGGDLKTIGNTQTSAGSSVEWGVKWGNWIGSGNPTTYTPPGSPSGGNPKSQEQIAVAWNLSQIVNLWNEKITYEYTQVTERVASGTVFTKASYVSKIKTVDRTIVFEYVPKSANEYADPHTEKSEPDAYQERFDTRYLDSAALFTKNGDLLRVVRFGYDLLNSGPMTKRLLTSVVETRPDGSVFGPPRVFEYWGQASGDGVSVTQVSDAKAYNAIKGALYGALKSVTLPSGAKTNYFYDQKIITTGERSLAISAPDSSWKDPHIYYGADYAVVLWRKDKNYSLSLYDWQGRWVPRWDGAKGVLIATTDPDSIRVSVSQNFFAVAAQNNGNALRLFWRKTGAPGQWSTQTVSLSLAKFQLRAGQNFVSLLDHGSKPFLRRYTFQDTGFKTEAVIDLPHSQYTIQKMDARKNFIATISGGPDKEAVPILKLFYLDQFGAWHTGASITMSQFFSAPGGLGSFYNYGLRGITLEALDFAVSLQAHDSSSYTVSNEGYSYTEFYYHYKHIAFRWSEDFSKVTSETLAEYEQYEQDHPGVAMAAIGDAIHLSTSGAADSYRFNGAAWTPAHFSNRHPNTLYGFDMLTTSSWEDTSHVRIHTKVYDPNQEAWSPDQFTFKEDDDSFWLATIEAFFGLANLVLIAIPVEGWVLDFFLNASLIGGELGADWLVHKFIHPDPQIGNGGLNYMAAHNDVYHRGPNGTMTKIDTLSDSGPYQHPPRISANAINYMTKVGGVHHNYVAILKNDVIYNRARIEPDESTNATVSTNPTDQQPLLGPTILVSYPASGALSNASSRTLYQIYGKEITGAPASYVVSRVEINDGYETRTTHYDYDTKHAALGADGEATIYNRVVTTQATDSLAKGFSEAYFYNGIDSALPFAPQADTNAADYPQLLSGEAYFTRACNYNEQAADLCGAVSSDTTYYRIYTPRAINGRQPFFARAVRQVAVLDGRTTTTNQTYDTTTGFLQEVTGTLYTGAGELETHTTKFERIADVYAHERAQLASLNLIAPVVRTTRTVTGAGANNTTASIEVAPWRNWSDSTPCSAVAGGRALWSPESVYVAITNDPGAFYFESGEPKTPANWLRKHAVTRVDCTFGVALETQDAAGNPGSYVYDTAFRKPVATFSHASVANHEAAYTSLERYEDLAAFQITGVINETRGHIGRRSLAGDTPSISLKKFQANGASAFVLGVFVRPPVGKTCTLAFGDAQTNTAQGQADGRWIYATLTTTKSSPLPSVSCPTGGAIDDFAVYPIDSGFAGAAYDPVFETALGIVKPNGQTQRYFYDSRNRMLGATNAADKMLHAAASFYSRCEKSADDCQGSETLPFSATRPNESVQLVARGGGAWFDFSGMARSEVSASFTFKKDSASAWGVDEDRLVLAEQNVATLKDTPRGSYAVRVRVSQNPQITEAFTKILSGSNVQSLRSPALADIPNQGLVLYAAGAAGTLQSFHAETGALIAQSNDGLLQEDSNLQVDEDGNVVFTDQYGALTAYNFRLQQVWRSNGPEVYGLSQAPVSDKTRGRIYARAVNNRIVAVNTSATVGREVGDPLWYYADAEARSEPSLGADGTIYFTGPGGLFALDSNGKKLFACGDQQFFTGDAPPISRKNVVYARSGGYIYAYNGYSGSSSCSKKWNTQASGIVLNNAGPIRIAGDGTILVPQYNTLYAFAENDGVLLWKAEFPEALIGMPAIHASGRILVSTKKILYALAPDSGDIQWEYSGPGDPPDADKFYSTYGSPVVSGAGAIYLFDSEKSTLVSYQLHPALQNDSRITWMTLYNGPRNAGSAEGGLARRDTQGTEAGPVRISIGDVSVVYQRGTYQFYDKDQPVGVPVQSEFSEDWFFVAFDDAALFYAGGRPLLSAKFSHAVAGELKLASPDAKHVAEFADLLIFDDPKLSTDYTDGAGRARQSQALENGDSIVLHETLYDSYGRAHVQTRPAPNSGRFGFRPNFVTGFSSSSGIMTGDVANYYSSSGLSGFGKGPSDDEGYPYYRKQYENNPLSRVTGLGEPGKDLAIRPENAWNTTEVRYGATDASNALLKRTAGSAPQDAYLAYSTSGPWGSDRFTTITLANGGGQTTAVQSGTDQDFQTTSSAGTYAARGDLTTRAKVPDDYAGRPIAPPLESTTDVAGRQAQSARTDSGTREFAYDTAGRLRAINTPVPNRVRYRKYDRIGRLLETGVCNCSWNTAQENIHNPNWPTSNYEVRSRSHYDTPGVFPGDNLVGRLAQVQTSQTLPGGVKTVIDSYSYDVAGRIVKHTTTPAGFPAQTTGYEYDATGTIRVIVYPKVTAATNPYGENRIEYTYDRLGRTTGVGLPPDAGGKDRSRYFAGYVYYADGSIQTETNNQNKISRSFQYASGGRVTGMNDAFLNQSFLYTDNKNQYWGRNVTKESFTYQANTFSGSGLAAPQSYSYTYGYDSRARFFQGVCSIPANTVIVSSDATAKKNDGYDANGNIQHLYTNGQLADSTYISAKNQIQTWRAAGNAYTYKYSDGGRVSSIAKGDGVPVSAFTYAPYDGLTLTAKNAGGQLEYWYGAGGKRALRHSGNTQTLYTYGIGANALMELPFTDGKNQTGEGETNFLRHIYGPTGLIATGDREQYYFYVKDRLGSTRVVYDESKKVRAYYNYLPFGGFMQDNSAENDHRFRFRYTGQEYDAEIDLYNYRARLYDPRSARFLAPDPVLDGPSPYAYVHNDPINHTDPTGMISVGQARFATSMLRIGLHAGLGAAIGASVGAGTGNAGQGAWIGAAVGGGLGVVGGIAEFMIPWGRALRSSENVIDHPAIFYNPEQVTRVAGHDFETGRMAAELIAEGEGIPRALWGDGQNGQLRELRAGALDGLGAGDFNGRIIVVQHGAERGMEWAREAGHLEGGVFRQHLGANASWENVAQIDLSVCLACHGGPGADNFATQLQGSLAEVRDPGARIRAANTTVTPLGTLLHSGRIRTLGNNPTTSQFFSYFTYGLHFADSIEEATAAGHGGWFELEAAGPWVPD